MPTAQSVLHMAHLLPKVDALVICATVHELQPSSDVVPLEGE